MALFKGGNLKTHKSSSAEKYSTGKVAMSWMKPALPTELISPSSGRLSASEPEEGSARGPPPSGAPPTQKLSKVISTSAALFARTSPPLLSQFLPTSGMEPASYCTSLVISPFGMMVYRSGLTATPRGSAMVRM
uniref:Uncharacterized protein n=1 Tax=Pyramimonas obovata TaxID=1411642 RepID=A0A7S0NB69_9CHLO